MTGPRALLRRVAPALVRLAGVFGTRFEHRIPLDEAEDFAPTIHLRGRAAEYATGQSERWITDYILRWIPGNGRT